MRVLADSAVTLARYHPDIVAADVVKRMLKVSVSVQQKIINNKSKNKKVHCMIISRCRLWCTLGIDPVHV